MCRHSKIGSGSRFITICRLTAVFYFISLLSPLFSAAQNRYDILITEFMPDPSPVVGMPEGEFIELTNHSAQDYNLHNWKISNGTATALIKTDYLLKKDSFLILCSVSSSSSFALYGSVLGLTGFPALNNNAGEIILSTDAGAVIHAVQYDKSWFQNELKAGGGWSLEMIDLSNPCGGKANWTASHSISGGTPGIKNSAGTKNPDEQPPSLIRAIATDSLTVLLIFDEAVDSAAASDLSGYTLTDGIGSPDSVSTLPPFFDRVRIHLQKPMVNGKIYTVSAQQIRDCSGNEISQFDVCRIGLPETLKPGDIIFNEILFNPPVGGYDYLELYNRSHKIISCSALFIAGRDNSGNIVDPVRLTEEERLLFPDDYLLITENQEWILQQYAEASLAKILMIPDMPSMPDDLGKLVLLNSSGELIDELDYDHHWHSPLLANESGVALERIDAGLPTAQATNWTSAAATAGYGTPGYKNSESYAGNQVPGFISLEPDIFSPDMDGYHDFCFINYHLPGSGFLGSISIYNISGRMVCQLVNNILWGISGSFRWDGLDDYKNPLPIGHYVIYAALFLPNGQVIKQKLVCTLVRKN